MDSNICLKAVNIDWDVDCAEDLDALPKEVQIPAGMVDPDEISDYLSDLTASAMKGLSCGRNTDIRSSCAMAMSRTRTGVSSMPLRQSVRMRVR